jgi:hypothetical protein
VMEEADERADAALLDGSNPQADRIRGHPIRTRHTVDTLALEHAVHGQKTLSGLCGESLAHRGLDRFAQPAFFGGHGFALVPRALQFGLLAYRLPKSRNPGAESVLIDSFGIGDEAIEPPANTSRKARRRLRALGRCGFASATLRAASSLSVMFTRRSVWGYSS